jgi:hypothetical protein
MRSAQIEFLHQHPAAGVQEKEPFPKDLQKRMFLSGDRTRQTQAGVD